MNRDRRLILSYHFSCRWVSTDRKRGIQVGNSATQVLPIVSLQLSKLAHVITAGVDVRGALALIWHLEYLIGYLKVLWLILENLFSILFSHINIEALLNFDLYFRFWVFICKLASHVYINIDWDFCKQLHRRHRPVVGLDLYLVTSSQGCHKHLCCRDIAYWFLIVLQFFPSCKLYVEVANYLKQRCGLFKTEH